MPTRPSTRSSLATNLRYLMKRAGWSEKDLQSRSGVSQKTINNAVNQRTATSIDNVDAMAKPFGLNGWQLIMPNLIADIESGSTITDMVANYLSADTKGQQLIFQLAEREAKYKIE